MNSPWKSEKFREYKESSTFTQCCFHRYNARVSAAGEQGRDESDESDESEHAT